MNIDKSAVLLSCLIAIFALGSWIDLNGIWVELPLLVNRLPEKWQLPTYIVTIVQIANIAPILYLTIHNFSHCKNLERYAIYLILGLGSICCWLLALFWDYTITTGSGREVSITFFILISLLSIVDTTSSLAFLPYLVNYHRWFITALYVGEGLSGLVPGVVGLLQGVGGEPYCRNFTIVINNTNTTISKPYTEPPRFSVSVFFIFLTVMMIGCLVAFSLVDNLKIFNKYRIKRRPIMNSVSASESRGKAIQISDSSQSNSSRENANVEMLLSDSSKNYLNGQNISNSLETSQAVYEDSKPISILYILLVGYINCLTNGVLPSLQNYSLLPYSNYLYHIVITVSQILNPIACLVTLYKFKLNWPIFVLMSSVASIGAAYLIFLAINSPNAFLGNDILGPSLAVSIWLAVGVIFSFEKTMLAIKLQHRGHKWLQLCGVATQLGSAIGALITFLVVGVFNLLTAKTLNCY